MTAQNTTRRSFLKNLGLGATACAFAGSSNPWQRTAHAQTSQPANPFAAPRRERPNILFLLTDDQAFSTLNALNNPAVKTPNMDRLVRRGTTFTHCFNQGAWGGAVCVASRAMLNTGRFLWSCGGNDCGDFPLWGETLGNAGYDT
ncbi:MAG: sulfatase-like hydrolase/transferase, partial [Planctomycetota bacterium]